MLKRIFYGYSLAFAQSKLYIKKLYINNVINKVIHVTAHHTDYISTFLSDKVIIFYIFNVKVTDTMINVLLKNTKNCVCFINSKINNDLVLTNEYVEVFKDKSISHSLYDAEAQFYNKKYVVNVKQCIVSDDFSSDYYRTLCYMFRSNKMHVSSFKELFYFLCNMYAYKSGMNIALLEDINKKVR